jgi:hypothetical protein
MEGLPAQKSSKMRFSQRVSPTAFIWFFTKRRGVMPPQSPYQKTIRNAQRARPKTTTKNFVLNGQLPREVGGVVSFHSSVDL